MRTATMSLEQWKAEQAEQSLSVDQKFSALDRCSEHLTHTGMER